MTSTIYPPSGSTGAVSIRRYVNDAIAEKANPFALESREFEFVCECGDLRCRTPVKMTLAQYRETRQGSVVAHA